MSRPAAGGRAGEEVSCPPAQLLRSKPLLPPSSCRHGCREEINRPQGPSPPPPNPLSPSYPSSPRPIYPTPCWHGCRDEINRPRLRPGLVLGDGAVREGGPAPRVVVEEPEERPAGDQGSTPRLWAVRRALVLQYALAPGQQCSCTEEWATAGGDECRAGGGGGVGGMGVKGGRGHRHKKTYWLLA